MPRKPCTVCGNNSNDGLCHRHNPKSLEKKVKCTRKYEKSEKGTATRKTYYATHWTPDYMMHGSKNPFGGGQTLGA